MTETEERIAMIRSSLSCFRFGLAALLPVVGLGFGVVALMHARKAGLHGGGNWNPARKWLRIGVALTIMGALWLVPFALFIVHLLSR